MTDEEALRAALYETDRRISYITKRMQFLNERHRELTITRIELTDRLHSLRGETDGNDAGQL